MNNKPILPPTPSPEGPTCTCSTHDIDTDCPKCRFAKPSPLPCEDEHGNALDTETTEAYKRGWADSPSPEGQRAEPFEQWWQQDGRGYDPDTEDVPWFDKRKGLAEYAFDAGRRSK